MTRLPRNQGLTAYLDQVVHQVRDAVGERLVGVWLLGSAALADYDPGRSDVDVQAVATEHLSLSARRALVDRLEHETLPPPARGLEFVLYAAEDLGAVDGPGFQLNLNTGPRMQHHVAFRADEDPRFWFTIDVSIARQSGVSLLGPPAAAVFPELPRSLVAAAVLEALDVYAGVPDATDQALLSACRAWAWAADGIWRSKGDGARWAMPRLDDPEPVRRAMRRRDGEPAEPPPAGHVERVLAAARAALGAARRTDHGGGTGAPFRSSRQRQGALADDFVVADRAFTKVTGARPRLARLARCDAHEGPVYLPDEDALYVTTVPGGSPRTARIKRIALDGGRADLEPERITAVPGHPVLPNGMTAWNGRLLVCEQGDMAHPARLSRLDPATGVATTVVNASGWWPLNSPNDVVVRRNGTIWFTDPSYGHLQGFRPPPVLPDAVHLFDPATGRVRIVADDCDKPNGLAFSPDESVLYVTDSGAVQEPGNYHPDRPHHVYAYDVLAGPRLANRRVLDAAVPGTPDGVTVDEDGRVYVCCADGVRVLSPEGTLLGRIAVPGAVNLTFGGRDRDRLFITADTAVWMAVLETRGA